MGRVVSGNSTNAAWADPDFELALDGSDRTLVGGGQKMGSCVINCTNDDEIYAFHSGGANTLRADGSVQFLRDSIAPGIVAALISRSGGEVFNDN